jgi:glucan biosynthesis protein C
VSYVLRIALPLGKDILGFPTLAYLPQYLSFFVIGIFAARRGWLARLPDSAGVVGLAMAVVGTLVVFPFAISGTWSFALAEGGAFVGNGTWQSAAYAAWDSIVAVGMALGLIVVFRRFVDRDGPVATFLARNSYAVYVLHAPILVHLAYQMRGIALPPLGKFVVVSVAAVAVTYLAAAVVRRIPPLGRVL